MAIVVRIERPHERTTEILLLICVPDAIVSRELVVVSDETRFTIRSQHIGHKRNLVIESLPAFFVDPLFDENPIVHSKNRAVAVAISRMAGVRALPHN